MDQQILDFDTLDIWIDLGKISDFDSLESSNMESIWFQHRNLDSLEVQDTEVPMLHRQALQSFLTSDPVLILDFIFWSH